MTDDHIGACEPTRFRGAVYVIAYSIDGPVKIGRSCAPEIRRITLQPGCPYPLVIHHVTALPGMNLASRLEQRVHKLLKEDDRYMRGEWFDITVDHAIEMIIGTAAWFDSKQWARVA